MYCVLLCQTICQEQEQEILSGCVDPVNSIATNYTALKEHCEDIIKK